MIWWIGGHKRSTPCMPTIIWFLNVGGYCEAMLDVTKFILLTFKGTYLHDCKENITSESPSDLKTAS